jgi:hypothetical protein
MPGFSFPPGDNAVPAFRDTGQGASGRLASWMAWTADPNPLPGPGQTNILRDDTFQPMLDGSSQGPRGGAISGGDNAFLQDV